MNPITETIVSAGKLAIVVINDMEFALARYQGSRATLWTLGAVDEPMCFAYDEYDPEDELVLEAAFDWASSPEVVNAVEDWQLEHGLAEFSVERINGQIVTCELEYHSSGTYSPCRVVVVDIEEEVAA